MRVLDTQSDFLAYFTSPRAFFLFASLTIKHTLFLLLFSALVLGVIERGRKMADPASMRPVPSVLCCGFCLVGSARQATEHSIFELF